MLGGPFVDKFLGFPVDDWVDLRAAMLAAGHESPAKLAEFLEAPDATIMRDRAEALAAQAKLSRITTILNKE